MHAADERDTSRAWNGVTEMVHGEVHPPGGATGVGPVEDSSEKNGDNKYRAYEEEARWIGKEAAVAFGEEREGE